MPKRNFVMQLLPIERPDRCTDCPLLGVVPKSVARPKGSKETMLCLGTMEAMSRPWSRKRESECDSHHPMHHYCEQKWHAWVGLPRREFPIPVQFYNECRVPYEQSLQLTIKFHKR